MNKELSQYPPGIFQGHSEISPAQEIFRTFTMWKYVGKLKMFPKNVPMTFLGGSFEVFFVMSPTK
jgi:hypothetical protein